MIPQNWREDLLERAEIACAELHIKETTLGGKIVGDADFFPSLREGAGCGVDKYQRIIAWFQKHSSSSRENNKNSHSQRAVPFKQQSSNSQEQINKG